MPCFRAMRAVPVLCLLIGLLASQTAMAHFVFIVAQDDKGTQARMVFSETLEPEDQVDVLLKLAKEPLKFSVRDMTGQVSDATVGKQTENTILLELPGQGTRVVYGKLDLGVMQRGNSKPNLLVYHAKSIIGDAFDVAATILNHPKAELLAVGKAGELRFQYNIEGKPAAKTQVVVVQPDGTEKRVVTDETGRTPAFEQVGHYGAWARYWEDTPGERDGKKYEQVRHYATLVVHVPAAK